MKKKLIAVILAPLLALGAFFGISLSATASDYGVAQILAQTNAARQANGLAPLTLNGGMSSVAYNWSAQQYANGVMSHNPNYTSQIPGGWTAAAENVAEHYTPDTVVGAWMNSPGHRANIMGPYTDIGIGVYTENGLTYFTQIFAAYGPIINAPSAPSNVTVGEVGTTTAEISWTPSTSDGGSPILDYLVTLALPGNPTPVTAVSGGNSVVVSGLTPGQYYDVTVQARNVVGYSSQAYWNSFTTVTTIPDAPVLAIGEVGTRTANIVLDTNFNGGLDITSHDVTLTDNTNGTTTNLVAPGVAPGAAITYPLTGLSPAHSYSVTAVAINGNGGSNVSATASFETDAEPPTVPQNVSLSTVSSNPTSLTTTWGVPDYNGGAAISNYSVYLYDSNGNAAGYVSVNADVTSYTFTAIERGKDYYTVVNAVNRGGSSPDGNSNTVNLPFSVPSAPFIGVAELVDEQTVKLDWVNSMDNGGTNIQNYTVDIYENTTLVDSINFAPIEGLNGTFTFDSEFIDAGKDYRFTVSATNSVGVSDTSQQSNNVVVPAVVQAPNNVTGVSVTDVTAESATVSWDASSYHGGAKIAGYNVTITNTDTGMNDVISVPADTLSAQLDELENYEAYMVTVTAFNVREESSGTTESFTTLAGDVSEPVNITILADTDDYGKAIVAWDTPTNLGGVPAAEIEYTVTLHNETLDNVFAEETITGDTTYTFEGLPGSSTFYATVTATNPASTSVAAVSDTYETPTESSAPRNVTVDGDSEEQSVSWDIPEDNGSHEIVGYVIDIEVTGRDGEIRETSDTVDATETSYDYSITGYGDTHVATVRAITVMTSTKSGVSDEWVSPATSPSAPVNLSGLDTTSDTITVTWDAPLFDGGADIAQYRAMIMDDDSGEVLDTILVQGSAERTATFTGLNRATVYELGVVAINESDLVSTHAISHAVTLPTVPGPVSNIHIDEHPTSDGNYAVTWDAPADNGGIENLSYDVTVENDGQTTTQTVNDTLVELNSIAPASTLKVTVVAVNGIGSSDSVSEEIETRLQTPGVPSNIIGSITEDNDVMAEWDASTVTGGGDVSYRAQLWSTTLGTLVGTEDVTDGTSVVFDSYETLPVHSYRVLVAAFNSQAESVFVESPVFMSNPAVSDAPRSVVDSVAVNYEVNDNTPQAVVDIDWDAPLFDGGAHITHYVVEALDEDMNVVHSSIATNTDYTFSAGVLELNTDYTVNITAVNSVGASAALVENVEVGITAPGVVTPYTVTPVNEDGNKVEFNWGTPVHTGGANLGDIEYRVVVFDGEDEVASFTTNDSTYTLIVGTQGDLKANTEYTTTISASNAAGESDVTNATFTTFMSPPAAPENVVLTSALVFDDPTPMWEVTWEAPTDLGEGTIQGYEVSIFKKLADNEFELIQTETADADATYVGITPATYNTYEHGETYVARVVVSNEQATSPYSEDSPEAIYPTGYPFAVQNLDAVVNADNSVTLNWDAPIHDGGSAITDYSVIATENDESGDAVLNEPVDGTTFTTEAFGPKETYRFAVIANNMNGGTSGEGSFVTLTTNAVAPDSVTNVSLVTDVADGVPNVTATWDAPAFDGGDDITGYVATLLDDDANVVETVETAANVRTAMFNNLAYVTDYTVAVSAVNAAGASTPANSNSIRTAAGAPSIPDYVLSYNEADETLELNWDIEDHNDNGAAITSYDLIILDVTGNEILADEEIIVDEETSFNRTVDTIIGNDYNVQLTATNSVGTSNVNEENITARNNIPNIPTGYVIFEGTTATLKWEPTSTDSSTEILHYNITIVGQNTNEEIEVDATETEYVFENLIRGNDYTFTVTAVNAAGASLPLTINDTATVERPSAPTDVRLRNLEKDTAHLVWLTPTDNGGSAITGYVITIRDTEGNVIDTLTESAKTTPGNVNTTILRGLPLGTTLNVTVQAENSAGVGNASVVSNNIKTAPTTVTVPDNVTAFQFSTQVDTSLSQDESMLFAGPHSIAEGAWTYAALYNVEGEKVAEFDWQVKLDGQLAYEIRNLKLANGTYAIGFLDEASTPVGIGSFNITKAGGDNGGGGDDDGGNNGGGNNNGGNDGSNNNGGNGVDNPIFNHTTNNTNNAATHTTNDEAKKITTTNSGEPHNDAITLIGFGLLVAIAVGLSIRRKKRIAG